jgi:hypothetical protein
MSIRSSTGKSQHRNARVAAVEAVSLALEGLGAPPLIVVLHAGIGYDQGELVRGAKGRCGSVPLVGCSGEGGICTGWSEESPFWVVAMALGGEGVSVRHGVLGGLARDSRAVGSRLRQAALKGGEKALFLFPDGLNVNVTRLYEGLGETSVPVLGGMAADDWFNERRSWQYCDGTAHNDAVAWFALQGDVHVAWASHHGCRMIHGESVVTRSRENVLQEIDGAPVMEYLKDCALTRTHGAFEGVALNIALFYQTPAASERQVTHVVLPSAGNLLDHVRIQPELPAGTRLWLARRDPSSISEDIGILADGLARGLEGRTPRALLHFDCAGRGRVMFSQDQLVRNLNRLHQAIPSAPPWAGFYSYGELAPSGQGNGFNNYSAVLATLSDP